jgi:tRNA/tmRNA/rRNA uracil-C5-methylase (TrmA/RlmC/RlmD family)
LLDTWEEPFYLSRLWCIFEQHAAIKLKIPITIILPKDSRDKLLLEISAGRDGIMRILACVGTINAEKATASVKADEIHTKRRISSTTGFWQVNKTVKCSMVRWVAAVVQAHMEGIILDGHGFTGTHVTPFEIANS